MPKIIRNLDVEAAKHANRENKVSIPKDFYARAGLSKINPEDVCSQWLVFDRVIFLNDEPLDQILKVSRQKLLLQLLTDFLNPQDSTRRDLRVAALRFIHDELFDSTVRIVSSKEELSLNYAGAILDKLASKNYGSNTLLNNEETNSYLIHKFISKPIHINMLPTVDAINGIFKRAYLHLTILDTPENQLNDLKLILREKLLRVVEPETHKKALLSFMMQYCYNGGLFFRLHSAHKNNLAAGMSFNMDEDYKQATINFITTKEPKIEIHEQIPISMVETLSEEYRSQPRGDSLSRSDQEDSLNILQVDQDTESDYKVDDETKSDVLPQPVHLNALETEIAHVLEIDRNGVVVPRPLQAITRVYNQNAYDFVTAVWRQQLEDVGRYADSFILNGGHDEKEINRLMKLYPHLENESSQLDPVTLRFMSLFSQKKAMEYKGNQIINFYGRNCSPDQVNHLIENLHSNVRHESLFKATMQLLRGMGKAEKVAETLRPYATLAGLSNPHAINPSSLVSEKAIQKLYPFLKPHDLYVVFKLNDSMKFTHATVIVQNPLSLVQFDVDGEKTHIFNRYQLMEKVFPALNYTFYLTKDLSSDIDTPFEVLDFSPVHLNIIKLSISRGLLDVQLTDQKILFVEKLNMQVAQNGIHFVEPRLKDVFVFTQKPAKLIYIDSTSQSHEILNEQGVQSLLTDLNFKYYLTDLVWSDTVNPILTNLPLEILRRLDNYITGNDGRSILENSNYFTMPSHPVRKEPAFFSLEKPAEEKVGHVTADTPQLSESLPVNEISCEHRSIRMVV